jgi:hypothetical protein
LTFLTFNINSEGVAAVLPAAPPKSQWQTAKVGGLGR